MNTPHSKPAYEQRNEVPLVRRKDPILEEVYSVKAKLNAQANYSVEKILERSRQTTAAFNLR
jgi:hypothetical protein